MTEKTKFCLLFETKGKFSTAPFIRDGWNQCGGVQDALVPSREGFEREGLPGPCSAPALSCRLRAMKNPSMLVPRIFLAQGNADRKRFETKSSAWIQADAICLSSFLSVLPWAVPKELVCHREGSGSARAALEGGKADGCISSLMFSCCLVTCLLISALPDTFLWEKTSHF